MFRLLRSIRINARINIPKTTRILMMASALLKRLPHWVHDQLNILQQKYKYLTVIICGVAMILDNMNVTGLVFAQEGIATTFNASQNEAGWTLSAYSLTFGSFLLLAGRAGDTFGHKQVFIGGLFIFTICCALAGGITSLIGLIVIRAFQGIAAAATIPTAYALVATTLDGRAREMAVAGIGAAQCLGVIMGTIFGGLFIKTSVSYRGIFWLSLGLGAISTIVGYLAIPSSPSRLKTWRNLDFGGAIIITISALLLVFGFSEAPGAWNQAKVISTIVVGALGILAFGIYEEAILPRFWKNIDSLVPRRVWGYKNFLPILLITALYYATFFSFQLNGSHFLVEVQDHSTIIASLMFLPIAGGAMVCMPVLGPLFNHSYMPPKWVIAIGQVLLAAGIAIFSRNGLHNSYWHYTFPSFLLVPIGASTFFVNFLNIVYSAAPAEEQGIISGITQMAAQICTALGFSIASTFITGGDRESLRDQYRKGFDFSLSLAVGSVIIATLFLKPIPPRARKTALHDEENSEDSKEDKGKDLSSVKSRD